MNSSKEPALSRAPFPSPSFRILCLAALLALSGPPGCVDDEAGGGGLYVYDGASQSVLVWKDVEKVLEAGKAGKEPPKADRTFTSGSIRALTLAWGGLALDDSHSRLYLVSEKGTVYAIANPRTQTGSISGINNITSFSLERYPGGSRFGPASVDPNRNVLYVVENDKEGDAARIWAIGNASQVPNGQTLGKDGHTFTAEGDKQAIGVAAGQARTVYGLFADGKHFEDSQNNAITGPRLREGTDARFPSNPVHQRPINTLIGAQTLVPDPLGYASLAYDGQRHSLYLFAHPSREGDPAKAGLLVFGASQFHGNHDQAPNRTLAEVPKDLRIIAHPLHAGWLVGAGFTPAPGAAEPGQGRGRAALYLWKSPADGGAPTTIQKLPGVSEIRGLAMGGE